MGAAAFDLLVSAGRGKPAAVTLDEVETAFAGMAAAKTTAIRAALVEGCCGGRRRWRRSIC